MTQLAQGPHPQPEDRSIWPPRLVEVYESGRWQPAQLEILRRTGSECLALVRFGWDSRNLPGTPHWVPAGSVRRRPASPYR